MAIKYDNCKDCHSGCVHAGKDRKFVCINGVSCKITTGKSQDCFVALEMFPNGENDFCSRG